MKKTVFFAALLALSAFAETNSIDWRYGKPGIRVVTNAPSRAEHLSLSNVVSDMSMTVVSSNTLFNMWFSGIFEGTNSWNAAYGWGNWASPVASNTAAIGVLTTNTVKVADTNGWQVGEHQAWLTEEHDTAALLRVASLDARTNDWNSAISSPTVTNHVDMSDGEGARIQYRSDVDTRAPVTLVIYFHGAGETETEAFTQTDEKRITGALVANGFVVASGSGKGSLWGAQAAQDSYVALYTYLINTYTVSKVFFVGQSMGALNALNLIASKRTRCDGFYGIYPLTSLSQAYATWPADIEEAYGFSGSENYATATSGYDPMEHAGILYSGIMFRLMASYGDTVVARTSNSDTFNTLFSSFSPYLSVVSHTGNHGDPTAFSAADVVAFCSNSSVINPSEGTVISIGDLEVTGDMTVPNGALSVGSALAVTYKGGGTFLNEPGINFGYSGIDYWIPFSEMGINSSVAAGGDISSYSSGGTNYTVHDFTISSSFTVTEVLPVRLCLGAGGGGGGCGAAGGGGAGGILITNITLQPGTYNVVIGKGGLGATVNWGAGDNGENSSFAGFTVLGGGGGGPGEVYPVLPASDGGSGGGGGGFGQVGGTSTQFTTYGYGTGFDGGTEPVRVGDAPFGGGGGGGAGGAGSDGTKGATAIGGAGGIGIQVELTGTSLYLGGGGGGAGEGESVAASGGSEVGGNGGVNSGYNGGDAVANTCSGGGGCWINATGGAGSDGRLLVRYVATGGVTDLNRSVKINAGTANGLVIRGTGTLDNAVVTSNLFVGGSVHLFDSGSNCYWRITASNGVFYAINTNNVRQFKFVTEAP